MNQHDKIIERQVLGSIFMRPESIDEITFLEPEDFYDPLNKLVLKSIRRLHLAKKEYGSASVYFDLKTHKEINSKDEDPYFEIINNLQTEINESQSIGRFARIVKGYSRDRQIHAEIAKLTDNSASVEDILKRIQSIHEATQVDEENPVIELASVSRAHEKLTDKWESEKKNPGIKTGLSNLDKLLAGGLRGGDMFGLAGSAGGGKSAFLGQVAYDAAYNGALILYFSFEMPVDEIYARLLSRAHYLKTGKMIDSRSVHIGEFEQDQKQSVQDTGHAMNEATGGRLLISHPPVMVTPNHIREAVKQARREHPEVKQTVVILDPLQRLMLGESATIDKKQADYLNRNEIDRVGILASEIKRLADNENIAVLFASDTTKSGAAGGQSSTQTLRGSYMLNHVCTVVGGIHTATTPEELAESVVGSFSTNKDAKETIKKNAKKPSWVTDDFDHEDSVDRFTHLEISKNRRGSAQNLNYFFMANTMSFFDATDEDAEEPGVK